MLNEKFDKNMKATNHIIEELRQEITNLLDKNGRYVLQIEELEAHIQD